jgi:transforming growth factor-beta-induced protein
VRHAVQAAQLRQPAEKITILAPTNAAFEALGQDVLSALAANIPVLREVLQGHILLEPVETTMVTDGATYEDMNNRLVTGHVAYGAVSFTASDAGTTAAVVTPDLASCAGIVQIVDKVLIVGQAGSITVPMVNALPRAADSPH